MNHDSTTNGSSPETADLDQEELAAAAGRGKLDEALATLDAAREPLSEDPAAWTPPEVVGLVMQYAFGVEALVHLGKPEWAEATELAEDVLFNRDLLAEWLKLHNEEALEDLLIDELDEVPLAAETDERLEQLYLENSTVRDYLHREYERFRDDVEPPRDHRWWWLDAELYGKQIH